jgi:hypothetical protein
MIRQSFNNLCPFCNHKLHHNYGHQFGCHNCAITSGSITDIIFGYNDNSISQILIRQTNNQDIILVSPIDKHIEYLKCTTNAKHYYYISEKVCNYIPDLPLQDLVQFVNTLILFQ